MIVLWQTPNISDRMMCVYRHIWTKFAARHGELVICLPYKKANEERELSTITHKNGRVVAFIQPSFIPAASFFEELDLMWEDEFYAAAPKAYRAVFNPGESRPFKFIETGVARDFLIFQLGGQNKFIPPASDVWKWVETTTSSRLLLTDMRYFGDIDRGASLRCNLGEVVPGAFERQALTVMGDVVTGGQRWYTQKRQRDLWGAGVEAWRLWTIA
jgi:hypothetical protein